MKDSLDLKVSQKDVIINYDDGSLYHPLLTCTDGTAVAGMLTWKDDKEGITHITCISIFRLFHVKSAEISVEEIDGKDSDVIVLTIGDETTAANKPIELKHTFIKGSPYTVVFKNLPALSTGGTTGTETILTRPFP
jgi:hypothetical protein